MALRNRCELSAMASSANRAGWGLFRDNRYIAERSLLYLYQDWATRREVERGISFGRSLDALCVTRVTLALGVASQLLRNYDANSP